MIPYKSFRYIYPPRPENAVSPDLIKDYDNGEYIAQPKLNGDCILVFTNGIETHVLNRHKQEPKKNYALIPTLGKLHRETIIEGEPKNKWMILVGEYMAKSKKNEEDVIWNDKYVIFDIIAFDSVQLLGKTFRERTELLDSLYGKDDVEILNDGVRKHKFMYTTSVKDCFRVKTYEDCFTGLWNDLVKIDMYEGLVFKRANAQLENGTTEKNNTNSQLKIRKPTKNYLY